MSIYGMENVWNYTLMLVRYIFFPQFWPLPFLFNFRYVANWTHISNTVNPVGCPNNSGSVLRIWNQTCKAIRQGARQQSRSPRTRPGLAFVAGPALVTVAVKLYGNVAHCQMDFNNNQPFLLEKKPKQEPEFNWTEFWKFLRPQLLSLLAAIVVSVKKSSGLLFPMFCWKSTPTCWTYYTKLGGFDIIKAWPILSLTEHHLFL